jgi:L-rhamnonate dehydratase
MKITDLTLRNLKGAMEVDGPFVEDRMARPPDVYEEFRTGGRIGRTNQIDGTHIEVAGTYLQIDTDEGVSGIFGPLWPGTAYHVWLIKGLVIGRDPFATEFLWDVMHRNAAHGRQGEGMMAISAIDNALWDLKGRALNQPVYSLIGGATQKTMPAYASMLFYNAVDMGLVRERAQQMSEKGYPAQKWFFRHGPMSGPEGLKLNIELVKTVREAVGPDVQIAFDAWQSWDFNYAVKMCERIAEFEPRWVEEVGMPDRIDTYRKVKERTSIPLSGAEHEYTRWGFKRWMDAEAVDIIQPDIAWCGGLSEILKIASMATAYDITTIAHFGASPQGMAFSASQSPIHTPLVELIPKAAETSYFFGEDGIDFKDGNVTVSEKPGFGFNIDPAKIESESVLEF